MALFDDIGAGIKAVLQHADFSALFPSTSVGYGFTWADTASIGKYGRCLVRPTAQVPVEGKRFDDSQQSGFVFEIRIAASQIDAAHTKWTAFLSALHKHLGDGGIELYTAIVTAAGGVPSTMLGGGVVAEIGDPVGTLPGTTDELGQENRDTIDVRVPLTVRAWHTT